MSKKAGNESAEDAGAIPGAPAGSDRITFLDLLIVMAKRKWLILGLPFCMAILAAIGSFLVPFVYTGTIKLLPPQQAPSTAGALLSQLGGLGGLASLAGGVLGSSRVNDIYIAMLKSRTVADNLIARFDLQKYYEAEKYTLSDVRLVLERRTSIVSGREGIITIEVEDKDAKFAAELANAYVEELAKLTKVLAVTEASRRRLFFEQQLTQARDNLTLAEVAARQGLQKGGLAQAEAQGRTIIEVTARLRAQVSAKEVQIDAMRSFASADNADLQRNQQELEALKRELARVEGSSQIGVARESGSGKSGLENFALLRNIKYYEYLYELLARQYEIAKMDEAKDSTIIQVLDKAVEPDRRTRPKRTQNVIVATLISGVFAVVAAFVLEAFAHARRDPEQVRRFRTLVGYLRFRRAG
jgi:tyrosine-protein kinase Etk/Wzc